MKIIKIVYRFLFSDNRVREHEVDIDDSTGLLVRDKTPPVPSWTALEHHQCANCPLKKDQYPQCPLALNLAAVADDFKSEKSFEKVVVEVVTKERLYRKALSLQEGLFGLFGLIMATSPCPHFEFLRAMAHFHLPFSSVRETMVRSVSFYLLRQYFVAKHGGKPDYDLVTLKKLYAELEIVNLSMANRLRSMTKADAEANSIIILDGFAKLLSMQLSKDLSELESMFRSGQ